MREQGLVGRAFSRLLTLYKYKVILKILPGDRSEGRFTRVLEPIDNEQFPYGGFFPPLRSLLLMYDIPVHVGRRRRAVCGFSFRTHTAKLSLTGMCKFEREGGYDSLSNARDVIQQFNPKHHVISSANSRNFWSYYRSFLFAPKSPALEIT